MKPYDCPSLTDLFHSIMSLKEEERTQTGKVTWKQKQRLDLHCHKPRNTRRHLKAGRNKEEFSPRAIGGRTALLTPWFWTSSLQNSRQYIPVVYIIQSVVLCCGSPRKLLKVTHLPNRNWEIVLALHWEKEGGGENPLHSLNPFSQSKKQRGNF